jgi:hypothetical protein
VKALRVILFVLVMQGIGAAIGFASYHFLSGEGGSPAPNRPPALSPREQPRNACCKVCSRGQACGNTCISRAYTCHVGPGCACNQ